MCPLVLKKIFLSFWKYNEQKDLITFVAYIILLRVYYNRLWHDKWNEYLTYKKITVNSYLVLRCIVLPDGISKWLLISILILQRCTILIRIKYYHFCHNFYEGWNTYAHLCSLYLNRLSLFGLWLCWTLHFIDVCFSPSVLLPKHAKMPVKRPSSPAIFV